MASRTIPINATTKAAAKATTMSKVQRRTRSSMETALCAFLGLLCMTLMVSIFVWTYLPDHDLHPQNHPLNNLHTIHSPNDNVNDNDNSSNNNNNNMKHSYTKEEEPKDAKAASSSSSSSLPSLPKYHMVFSTSCSESQDWQSYVLFYSAMKVQQRGTVTRIASGCTDVQRQALQTLHDTTIAIMNPPHFKIHFAPPCPDTRSKYFNKPFGIRDWMQHVLQYQHHVDEQDNNKDGSDTTTTTMTVTPNIHDDDIIMIVDPDMMLLRPLTHQFDVQRIKWVVPQDPHLVDAVSRGHPISQAYGFGASWMTSLVGRANRTYIAGPTSPALKVKIPKEAAQYYPAGPPYLATAHDMYRIAIHWTKFVVRIHTVFPHFMSEMHAYSFAAAHVQLPHQLSYGFMVSDVGVVDGEGWDFLTSVSREQTCLPNGIPMTDLPYVFHYCQRYALGRWFVGKYKVPKNFFQCSAPLFREPPYNATVVYDWYMYPNGKDTANYSNNEFKIKQNGWAMCRLIHDLNEIVSHYKTNHCGTTTTNANANANANANGNAIALRSTANFNKTFIFHDPKVFDAFLQGDIPDVGPPGTHLGR